MLEVDLDLVHYAVKRLVANVLCSCEKGFAACMAPVGTMIAHWVLLASYAHPTYCGRLKVLVASSVLAGNVLYFCNVQGEA